MRDLTEFARSIIEGACEAGHHGFIGEHSEFMPNVWKVVDRYESEELGEEVSYEISVAKIIVTLNSIFHANSEEIDHLGLGEEGQTLISRAMLDEDEEGQCDVVVHLAIVEIAIFGTVTYN